MKPIDKDDKILAMDTTTFFTDRAARGSTKKLQDILMRVPNVPPIASDLAISSMRGMCPGIDTNVHNDAEDALKAVPNVHRC